MKTCTKPASKSFSSSPSSTNVNNDQVGTVVKFAMENPRKSLSSASSRFLSTGRDEDITPERRLRQRTLSHLAQTSALRSAKLNRPATGSHLLHFDLAGFATWLRATNPSGVRSLALPPNCGVGTALMITRKPRMGAGSRFLDATQLTADVTAITTRLAARFLQLMMAMALLKNYHRSRDPRASALRFFSKIFDKTWRSQEVHHQVRPHFTRSYL